MFRKRYPYVVTFLLSGHHPYMDDPTFDMFEGLKQEQVHVMAKSYDHAVKVANGWDKTGNWRCRTKAWARTVLSVRMENAGDSLLPGRAAPYYRCGQN